MTPIPEDEDDERVTVSFEYEFEYEVSEYPNYTDVDFERMAFETLKANLSDFDPGTVTRYQPGTYDPIHDCKR